MAEITTNTPIGEMNLEVLVHRMVVYAAVIKRGGNLVLEPINLHDKPLVQYPLSEFLISVRDSFLQLPNHHRLREKYTIHEVSQALGILSRYERNYGSIDPEYVLKADAA